MKIEIKDGTGLLERNINIVLYLKRKKMRWKCISIKTERK